MTMNQITTTQTNSSQDGSNKTYYSGMGEDSDIFKKPDIAMLNCFYLDGESCDQDVFAEMRSNVLLVAGEHWNRRQSRFYKRIRDSRELSQEQKLRLTKNHTRKICQAYANNIISMNPGVGFSPKDEGSLHDQKVAELHHSVWRDGHDKYGVDDLIDDWVDSFIELGEVHVKIFYDPSLGPVKGYEPQTDPESGNPMLSDFGEMVADDQKPVVDGEFVFEEIYGMNLLRPPECKELKKAEWLCSRKMSNKEELLRRFKDNPDIQKLIVTQQDETFVVFDAIRGGYKKSSKQTMIREYFFRPNLLFPEGYFYITTKEGILSEGELPGGFFPIVTAQFDKIKTTCRGRSPIKQMRSYQAEINRAASKIAEHQITLGDDKLILQNGTKVSSGASLPGVRTVNVTGSAPTILEGRTGEQYASYMTGQITEMYQVMNVAEDTETADSQMDPYVLLFRSARQKKKFQRYIKRFEKFLVEVVHLYLRLAKIHLPDDAVIMAIGKSEQVNIQEFRQMKDTNFEVKIEAQSDDIETKLGKQIVINHALQYAAAQMKPEDIGKVMRQMPFADFEGCFDDMTLDYDTSVNEILALDRGETPPINQYDNHIYSIKRLTQRSRKADFKFLSPQIQGNYQAKINMHQQFEAQNQMAIQQAESGFIPTGGYLVGCDFYVNDPSDPNGEKTRRARVPYQALDWLIKKLESQGQGQEDIENMNQGEQAQLAGVFNKMKGAAPPGPGQAPPSGMMRPPQPMGNHPMGMKPPGSPMPSPGGPPPGGAPSWNPQQMYRQPVGPPNPMAMSKPG